MRYRSNWYRQEREYEPCEVLAIVGTLLILFIGIIVGVAIATA